MEDKSTVLKTTLFFFFLKIYFFYIFLAYSYFRNKTSASLPFLVLFESNNNKTITANNLQRS